MDFVRRNAGYIESINYGTGENPLSENWYSLLRYINTDHPGINQALTTNGYFIEASRLRKSVEEDFLCLSELDVSLDFYNPKRHNEFRGHDNAFKWALGCIQEARRIGITTTIVVMGIDETLRISNLKGIFNIAAAYGAYVRINLFRPNAGQSQTPCGYSALKESLLWLAENYEIVSIADSLLSPLLLNQGSIDRTGLSSLRILPDGSITPSTYLTDLPWRIANIQCADLSRPELLDSFKRKIPRPIPTSCQLCNIVPMCQGGVLDRRYIWYGTAKERDPYCPKRFGEDTSVWQPSIITNHKGGPTIHSKYLPTLIFSPNI